MKDFSTKQALGALIAAITEAVNSWQYSRSILTKDPRFQTASERANIGAEAAAALELIHLYEELTGERWMTPPQMARDANNVFHLDLNHIQ